jgi:hypothetical protein
MSAKKVSKMCNFVHKLVKNAHFSPRKVQKRGFFAGGRGDFLAGQKRGFLGSRESRASGAASCENRSQSLTPRWPHRNTIVNIRIKSLFGKCVLRTHRAPMDIMDCYRHSELAERTESVHLNFYFYNSSLVLALLLSRAACTPIHEA